MHGWPGWRPALDALLLAVPPELGEVEEETNSILPRGSALTNGQRPQINTCLEGVA